MIKDALEYFAGLANRASDPHIVSLHGLPYSTAQLRPIGRHTAEPLVFSTLIGLLDYCRRADGSIRPDGAFLHVASPTRVALYGPLGEQDRVRECFARAEYDNANAFHFGAQFEHEAFVIALSALFAPSEDRARLLKLVGNLTAETVSTSTDDGITQTVGQRMGVALQRREKIGNPFVLAPLRTFAEIPQVASPFLFRVHQDQSEAPTCALYECDGGAWRVEAIRRVGSWLSSKLAGVPVLA